MDYTNTRKIFIFVDESGDVGDPHIHASSSRYFTINIAVATESGVSSMNLLISGFNFFNNHKKELKKFKGEHLQSFADKLWYLDDVVFYETVIDKKRYTGPYLRGGDKRPLWFRNFVLKITLEHVSAIEGLLTLEKPIELVIDRYTDNKESSDNLRNYLAGDFKKTDQTHKRHINLPKFLHAHIVQVDSRYCPQIQLLDVIQKVKGTGADIVCTSVPTTAFHI